MKRRSRADRWRRVLLGGLAAFAIGAGVAAPVAPSEANGGREPARGGEGKWADPGAAATARSSQAAVPDADAADAAAGQAPLTVATLPRRAASAVPVDEDPQVDMGEVVDSVGRATAAAVPWLRLGGRPHDEAHRRHEASGADMQADLRLRIEDSASRSAAGGSDGDDRHLLGGAERVNLVEEALAIARDFIANPLTWLLGIPVLLGGFMVAVLRGRGK